MLELKPETVIEIAEKMCDLNLFISLQEKEGVETIDRYAAPFDNNTLKDLLSDRRTAIVKEYVFKPKHSSFLVRYRFGRFSASTYANQRQSREILTQIERILFRLNTGNGIKINA